MVAANTGQHGRRYDAAFTVRCAHSQGRGSAGGHLALMVALTGGTEGLEPAGADTPYPGLSSAVRCAVNMYGITETTVHVTHRDVTHADALGETGSVIGRAIEDLSLWVLDPAGEPVPRGVVGELSPWFAGPLARRVEAVASELTYDLRSGEPDSLDQMVAAHLGTLTRFPSLTLSINGNTGLSFTGGGVAIPPEQKAANVYKQLFVQGSPAEVEAQLRRLAQGRSILDAVGGQARDLQRSVGSRDRDRLDQYFTSVRDLESRLKESEGWERKPKPVVTVKEPVDPQNPAWPKSPTQLAPDMKAPVLGLYGAADAGIPVETLNQLEAALKAAGTNLAGLSFTVYVGYALDSQPNAINYGTSAIQFSISP